MIFLKRIVCYVLGHKYFVRQKLTPWSRRVGCHRCKADWGMNDDARSLIAWDDDLEEMYRAVGVKIDGK